MITLCLLVSAFRVLSSRVPSSSFSSFSLWRRRKKWEANGKAALFCLVLRRPVVSRPRMSYWSRPFLLLQRLVLASPFNAIKILLTHTKDLWNPSVFPIFEQNWKTEIERKSKLFFRKQKMGDIWNWLRRFIDASNTGAASPVLPFWLCARSTRAFKIFCSCFCLSILNIFCCFFTAKKSQISSNKFLHKNMFFGGFLMKLFIIVSGKLDKDRCLQKVRR